MRYKIGMHPNSRKNLIKARKFKSIGTREKISDTLKERYKEGLKIGFQKGHVFYGDKLTIHKNFKQDIPEFVRKRIKAIMKKPNKTEQFLIDLLNENNLPYRYVGNGQVIIQRKCPDFINCDGQKKIIELFGNYWHKPKEEFERKKLFSQYGFKTLIIWEHELKDKPKVLEKIIKFERG